MSATELVLAGVTTFIGVLAGIGTGYYFFRRGAPRRRISVGMAELARIDPATLGVEVEMRVGTTVVSNLALLEVTVTNRGPSDLVIEDADDPDKHPLRPRIELPPDLRALADPWNPLGATAGADVRLARRLVDARQVLHVHIHRLAAGSSSRARVVCTDQSGAEDSLAPTPEIRFFPGYLPDVDVLPADLLAPPLAPAAPLAASSLILKSQCLNSTPRFQDPDSLGVTKPDS